MHCPLTVGLLGMCLVAALAGPCCCEPTGAAAVAAESLARPIRPKVFTSPDDLRAYLENLSNYYAIVGRPRFGKRVPAMPVFATRFSNVNPLSGHMSVSQPETPFHLRIPPSNTAGDLYEMVMQYDE